MRHWQNILGALVLTLAVVLGLGAVVKWHAVMVLDGKKLIGIFTERDCLHKITALGRKPQEVLVSEVMTKQVRFVTQDMEISQGLALMTERFLRHLPVLDEQENILGIVSIGDLVKAKISDQSFIIEQMERYITS